MAQVNQTSWKKLENYATQGSSNDRSGAITKANQTYYHQLVDTAYAEAERLSREACPVDEDGKTWLDLSEHFIANLDESNNMANAGSGVVVGDKTLQKHEQTRKSPRQNKYNKNSKKNYHPKK